MKFFILCLMFVFSTSAIAQDNMVKGFSLTEIGTNLYDTSTSGLKADAQKIVDQLYDIGVRRINLSPRAVMTDPRGNEVIPRIMYDNRNNPGEIAQERRRYISLIKYIKSKGMTVGMRPIFFVIDENGQTPVITTEPDGTQKTWWHGNIQPNDPNRWFESFKTFLDRYMTIAKYAKVDEFTIGAELYSMTVGIEDQWMEHPHGFPGRWLSLLNYAKSKLPASCAIMYDINFTDDTINTGEITEHGGEFARWKYRLVDLADPNDDNWVMLAEFWKGLDFVGIDMYRSLASDDQIIPENQESLTILLQQASDRYAAQIDNTLFEIEMSVGESKEIILKEIGYRSIDKGFVRPFEYAGDTGFLNVMHQAAAYDAVFRSFFQPQWPWFKGAVFWDASVDPKLHGPTDLGFSPLGKNETMEIIKEFFGE